MPKLYVQAIDAYRFQRELRHEPGNSEDIYWESRIYQHPGRRDIQSRFPENTAVRFITGFLRLCAEYPTLLFNEDNANGRARHEGFVHLAERLHRDELFSVRLLE